MSIGANWFTGNTRFTEVNDFTAIDRVGSSNDHKRDLLSIIATADSV